MKQPLLLYDTTQADLARDARDFLAELGLKVEMIPLAADVGASLQSKEDHYFAGATAAIFLLTPGALRDGRSFPSPSVTDEMGRAREQFKATPEKVIYLVDERCHVQAVDSKVQIRYSAGNPRSLLQAITQLIRNLRAAGVYPTGNSSEKPNVRPARHPDLDQLASSVPPQVVAVCEDLSKRENGVAGYRDFEQMLRARGHSTQGGNFIKIDLRQFGLATLTPSTISGQTYWRLTPVGFGLVRLILRRREEPFGLLAQIAALGRSPLTASAALAALAKGTGTKTGTRRQI